MLRRRSSGVARFSQHMLGHAMDFYIPGVPLEAAARDRAAAAARRRRLLSDVRLALRPHGHRQRPALAAHDARRSWCASSRTARPCTFRATAGRCPAMRWRSPRSRSAATIRRTIRLTPRAIPASTSAPGGERDRHASIRSPSCSAWAKDDDDDDADFEPPPVAAAPAPAATARTQSQAVAVAAVATGESGARPKWRRRPSSISAPIHSPPRPARRPRSKVAPPLRRPTSRCRRVAPNQIIIARGYWQGPRRRRRRRGRRRPLAASPWRPRDRHADRNRRPVPGRVRRPRPAGDLRSPMPNSATRRPRHCEAARRRVRRPGASSASAEHHGAVNGVTDRARNAVRAMQLGWSPQQPFDNPWMRADRPVAERAPLPDHARARRRATSARSPS